MLPERLRHIVVNGLPALHRQVSRRRVFFQLKLCPHDEVDYLFVDAVRPVVVQDLDVVCTSSAHRG